MTSFRFVIGLIAMALVATPIVKATDLTVGSTASGRELGSASDTRFYLPYSVEVLPGDEVALVSDYANKRIVNVSLVDGFTTEFMTTGSLQPRFLALCDDGLGYFSSTNGVEEFNTSDTSPSASPWGTVSKWIYGMACLKNSTHDLLFVAGKHVGGIRAYDRTNGPPANEDVFVWEVSLADLDVSYLLGISVSPDMRHLAFATNVAHKVGTVNLETNTKELYGSGTQGVLDGAANDAQFDHPYDVAWTPDGSKILVNELGNVFSGLRFIDFATGDVSSSANGLMPPTSQGRGVTVLRSTEEVVVTYANGLKKMPVAGVTPQCGNVPTVGNSDGGNNATAVGFVRDTVTFVCDAGFTSAGTSQITTTCQSDTLAWSTVSGCQSDAEFIIAHLGNSTDAESKSTLQAVVKALGISLCGGATSEVSLQAWCQQREFQ